MVAYSFNRIFADPVTNLEKRQTARAERRRHARVGEAVQLYTGMRTRSCRKLVEDDPICTRVDEIRLVVPLDADPLEIEINGIQLGYLEIEAFARADGFGHVCAKDENGQWCGTERWPVDRVVAAECLMAAFWMERHGVGPWRGVVIHWEPRS